MEAVTQVGAVVVGGMIGVKELYLCIIYKRMPKAPINIIPIDNARLPLDAPDGRYINPVASNDGFGEYIGLFDSTSCPPGSLSSVEG